MGLGILEPQHDDHRHHVPGTSTLDQLAAGIGASNNDVKHGLGKDSHIVLVPQPSNDPNDPLNWSATKRNVVFYTILMGTAFVCIIPVCFIPAVRSVKAVRSQPPPDADAQCWNRSNRHRPRPILT